MKKLLVIFIAISLSACNSHGLDDIKSNACSAWAGAGYTCVGYEGYNFSITGAEVWYTLRRDDTPGVVYSGFVKKWGDEYHLYGPRVVNAILTK